MRNDRGWKVAAAVLSLAVAGLAVYAYFQWQGRSKLNTGQGPGMKPLPCSAEQLATFSLYRDGSLLWRRPVDEFLSQAGASRFQNGPFAGKPYLLLKVLLDDEPIAALELQQCHAPPVRLAGSELENLAFATSKTRRLKLIRYQGDRRSPTLAKNIVAVRLFSAPRR